MFNCSRWVSAGGTFLTLGLVFSAMIPWGSPASDSAVLAQEDLTRSFPDIQDHWARPFIAALAEKEILTGYLDGTYRPNRPVDRDEFAAIIRQAFNQKEVANIPRGSIYKDVPTGYWAAPAIEEAYEMGLMQGYPGGFFRPKEEVSRVEALVTLTNVLEKPSNRPISSTNQTTPVPVTTNQTTPNPTTTQSTTTPTTKRKISKNRLLFPLGFTALMEPVFRLNAKAQDMRPSSRSTSAVANDGGTSPPDPSSAVARDQSQSPQTPPSFLVSDYYTDAKKIPHYAVDDVAKATRANIVVNYPELRVLNPNQPATRGEIAAFIYQTLVTQGKIQPLAENVEASNYVVDHTTAISSNPNAQPAQ